MNVEVVKLHEDVELPQYESDGAAGMDIKAFLTDTLTLYPKETLTIPTGLSVAIPKGYEMQIRSRSGLSIKGVIVANSPGTIDSDFRGEVKIILRNTSPDMAFGIRNGDRIAQMVLCPVEKAVWRLVDNLPDTDRGSGGFGSTGI